MGQHVHHDHGHSHGASADHHHGHRHGDGDRHGRALHRAAGITVFFMVVEAVGGWWANSLSLLSDSAHMLTDVGALLLSAFVLWVARRPSTPQMSFGYHRAEILGALVSGIAIWGLSGFLVYEAVLRIQDPPPVNGPIVFGIAGIGLVSNLFSLSVLRPAQGTNLNLRAAYLHVLGDMLGSLGALAAGLVLWLTGWRPIDPIVTLGIAALMLLNSWALVREAVAVLMESAPAGVDPVAIREALSALPHVREVHDLHIWSVTSGRLALSAHVISERNEEVLSAANALLEDRYGIRHTTLQIEHPERFRSERCYDCASMVDRITSQTHP